MSYRIVGEVREALRTGQIKLTGKKTGALDRLVWLLIADDCRDDTRQSEVGMAELSEIVGVRRAAISRSVHRLEDAGCIHTVSYGNRAPGEGKGKTSKYEIPAAIPCITTGTSNAQIDVPLTPIDVPVGAIPCTRAGVHLQVLTPGTTPGEETPSSLRSDGVEKFDQLDRFRDSYGFIDHGAIHRLAQKIVTRHISYLHKDQQNRYELDAAVKNALTLGLDEATIVSVIEQQFEPGSDHRGYVLNRMLSARINAEPASGMTPQPNVRSPR
jgi:hypothetical protein